MSVFAPPELGNQLPGEEVGELQLQDESVTFHTAAGAAVPALITITNFRVAARATRSAGGAELCDVPVGAIHHVEKLGKDSSSGSNSYGIIVHCKDVRRFTITVPAGQNHARVSAPARTRRGGRPPPPQGGPSSRPCAPTPSLPMWRGGGFSLSCTAEPRIGRRRGATSFCARWSARGCPTGGGDSRRSMPSLPCARRTRRRWRCRQCPARRCWRRRP